MKNKIVKRVLQPRSNKSNKGNYNKVLIYAGSDSYPGAALLACKASLYSGVGQVILANDALSSTLYTALPEVTYIKRDLKNSSLINTKITSILFGNGLDYPNKTISKDFNLIMKEFTGKLIIDATGLKYLKDYIKTNDIIMPELILTPHIKEFCELTDTELIGSNVLTYESPLNKFIEQYPKMVVVLKSYETLIKTRRQRRVFSKPNSGFAHAGTGDALAGLIAGLFAYNPSYSVDICYTACYLLNLALKKEERKNSSMAITTSSILDLLPLVIKGYVS